MTRDLKHVPLTVVPILNPRGKVITSPFTVEVMSVKLFIDQHQRTIVENLSPLFPAIKIIHSTSVTSQISDKYRFIFNRGYYNGVFGFNSVTRIPKENLQLWCGMANNYFFSIISSFLDISW